MSGYIPPLPQYAFMIFCSVEKEEAQGHLYLLPLPLPLSLSLNVHQFKNSLQSLQDIVPC
jgi:hypothetical protein